MLILRKLGCRGRNVIKCFMVLILFAFLCEYAIYPIVLFQCSWPSVEVSKLGGESNVVKAMFLADTHLLGPFRGHWFDKLRREWQMHRAFQTAINKFQPEVVFFLGDLFDEGEWVKGEGFKNYVKRFEELFYVPETIKIYVVAGNHDIGFHYRTTLEKEYRFQKAFNTTPVRLLRIKKSNFVLINSMAMELDGCFLCKEALKNLNSVQRNLGCQKYPENCTKEYESSSSQLDYSAPVLLQHFPLYRESDLICTGEDSAPDEEKMVKFRIGIDSLSNESSSLLLTSLKPQLIMSGHTHHHCVRNHFVDGHQISEISVPSFSWRNRDDPSFYLGYFGTAEYHLSKCYMPKESTVNIIYVTGLLVLLIAIIGIIAGL